MTSITLEKEPAIADFAGLRTNAVQTLGVHFPKILTLDDELVFDDEGQKVSNPPEDNKNQISLRRKAKERENQLPKLEITSVKFGFFSRSEVKDYSVVELASPSSSGPTTVRDTKMGVSDFGQLCDTCSKTLTECPGHYGMLRLPKIMHPLAVQNIILVLNSICTSIGPDGKYCCRLLVTEKEINESGIGRMKGKSRLIAISKLVGSLKRRCQGRPELCKPGEPVSKCSINPSYCRTKKLDDKIDYRLAYILPRKGKEIKCTDKSERNYLMPNELYQILSQITSEDATLIGFAEHSPPSNMIIDRLPVIPICARPDLNIGTMESENKFTTTYQTLIKSVAIYNAATDEGERERAYATIYKRVLCFFKDDPKLNCSGNNKKQGDITTVMKGKEGMIRQNTMGKRVNYAGRTVASPGGTIRTDQIGIPIAMSYKLTVPRKVTPLNKKKLQKLYEKGKVQSITFSSGHMSGIKVPVRATKTSARKYKLKNGDIVDRNLQDGDIVLVNRQPSLHKYSFIALYVVLFPWKTVRLPLPVTSALNADFDGDELNIHVPQTPEAQAEAETLLSVRNNLISEQTNKPMIKLIQDTITGCYILSKIEDDMDKIPGRIKKWQTLLEDEKSLSRKIKKKVAEETIKVKNVLKEEDFEKHIKEFTIKVKETIISRLTKKIQEAKDKQASTRISLRKSTMKTALEHTKERSQTKTLDTRLKKYNIPVDGGRALLSSVFPEDFDYRGKGVIIKEGILVSGTLSDGSINSDGGIIAEMYKQKGGSIVVDFLTDIQLVCGDYLERRGFSVGMDDAVPRDPKFKEQVNFVIKTALLQASTFMKPSKNDVQRRYQERKILEQLDIADKVAKNIIEGNLTMEQGLIVMAVSGAKGKKFNIAQISSLVGQQRVNGERIQRKLPGNRTLPYFEPNNPEPIPEEEGFITNSFSSGLNPAEFFFHAMGSREGLTDTAVNTAKTGYLQKRLVKSSEDTHITSDGSVRTADGSIVQFVYGDDGMDASELTTVGIQNQPIPFFRNMNQLFNKIQRKYS